MSYVGVYVIFELHHNRDLAFPRRKNMRTPSRSKSLRKKALQGQNVIEYLLVTTVVVLICIAFFNPNGGPGRTALENIANDIVVDVGQMNSEIQF